MADFSFKNLNPFGRWFDKTTSKSDQKLQDQKLKNAQGVSTEDVKPIGTTEPGPGSSGTTYDGYSTNSQATQESIQFTQVFTDKKSRVAKYREMANYPEAQESIEYVCDDAMVKADNGNIATLKLSDKIPKNVKKALNVQWDYMINDVIKFNECGWDMFNRWLIDGELYGENVLDDSHRNIIDIKLLPSYSIAPIYQKGIIKGFTQHPEILNPSNKAVPADFKAQQINYINYGKFGARFEDTRGYLESSVKTYNQLKMMEDAVVVYRLARAPEKLVFKLDTGRMPKPQQDAYLRKTIQKYRKRMFYDPATGAINSAQNFMALTEAYWFAHDADGRGSSVETLPGGATLGELDDVKFFLTKFYKSMKIPKSRFEDSNTYNPGKMSEITRDEIKFSNFIDRLRDRFKYFLLQPFIIQLKLSKTVEDKYIDESLFDVTFGESNLYKEYKELEILNSRVEVLTSLQQFIYTEESKGGIFDPDFVLKRYFKMSQEDFDENNRLLTERKAKEKPPEPETPPEGDGGNAPAEGEDLGVGEPGGPLIPPEITNAEPVPKDEEPAPKNDTGKPPTGGANESISFSQSANGVVSSLFDDWLKSDKEIMARGNKKGLIL